MIGLAVKELKQGCNYGYYAQLIKINKKKVYKEGTLCYINICRFKEALLTSLKKRLTFIV